MQTRRPGVNHFQHLLEIELLDDGPCLREFARFNVIPNRFTQRRFSERRGKNLTLRQGTRRYEIISLIAFVRSFFSFCSFFFFFFFFCQVLQLYFACTRCMWVRGHVSFDSSMDYSSLNCMHAARILTFMFQLGARYVSFKGAKFFFPLSFLRSVKLLPRTYIRMVLIFLSIWKIKSVKFIIYNYLAIKHFRNIFENLRALQHSSLAMNNFMRMFSIQLSH